MLLSPVFRRSFIRKFAQSAGLGKLGGRLHKVCITSGFESLAAALHRCRLRNAGAAGLPGRCWQMWILEKWRWWKVMEGRKSQVSWDKMAGPRNTSKFWSLLSATSGGSTLGSSRPRTASEAVGATFGRVVDSFLYVVGCIDWDGMGWNGSHCFSEMTGPMCETICMWCQKHVVYNFWPICKR